MIALRTARATPPRHMHGEGAAPGAVRSVQIHGVPCYRGVPCSLSVASIVAGTPSQEGLVECCRWS
jgi:hypothetical protein